MSGAGGDVRHFRWYATPRKGPCTVSGAGQVSLLWGDVCFTPVLRVGRVLGTGCVRRALPLVQARQAQRIFTVGTAVVGMRACLAVDVDAHGAGLVLLVWGVDLLVGLRIRSNPAAGAECGTVSAACLCERS